MSDLFQSNGNERPQSKWANPLEYFIENTQSYFLGSKLKQVNQNSQTLEDGDIEKGFKYNTMDIGQGLGKVDYIQNVNSL